MLFYLCWCFGGELFHGFVSELYDQVTPFVFWNFIFLRLYYIFCYENYHRSVKLDRGGTGHLWRMWVNNKNIYLITKEVNYSAFLYITRCAYVCVCKGLRMHVWGCSRTFFSRVFLRTPTMRPTYTLYRLSVPLFYHGYALMCA